MYHEDHHEVQNDQRVQIQATWKREFKLPWREAVPPNHHDDKVDSDQQVVNKELSLCRFGQDGHERDVRAARERIYPVLLPVQMRPRRYQLGTYKTVKAYIRQSWHI